MYEPNLIPPGHGDYDCPIAQERCPHCASILQNPHPASRADNRLEGWCPEHGTVRAVYGDREAILAAAP